MKETFIEIITDEQGELFEVGIPAISKHLKKTSLKRANSTRKWLFPKWK